MIIKCIKSIIVAFSLSLLLQTAAAAAEANFKQVDMSNFFGRYKTASFVLYNCATDKYYVHNLEGARKRYSPCSSFKILNSLIGLETGVIKNENHVIEWDGKDGRLKIWNQDHTLTSAIKNSVVWYYQALAKSVGEKRMKKFVEAAQYGNMDISGGLTKFWLHGPEGTLKISALEQVEFLKKFVAEKLPFSEKNIRIVKKIIELQAGEDYSLSGKTGSGTENGRHVCGWFIGFVKTHKTEYVFATLIAADYKSEDSPALGTVAKKITMNILKSMELIK
jgi:beta-lactamase class D